MNESALIEQSADTVEESLRDALAGGDAVLVSARPVLRHLLNSDHNTLFNDETIARVRGILRDIARQWLFALAEVATIQHRERFVQQRMDDFAASLARDAELLAHAHALTLEAQQIENLERQSHIDAVLTPLIQDEAAGSDAAMAGLAMSVLAAQARFTRQQLRMELPLGELPGELFHRVILALSALSREHEAAATRVAGQLRANYAEGQSRLGLLSRFIAALGARSSYALAVENAGLPLFVTAIAALVHQQRDLTILSLGDRQFVRLVLALRAADLNDRALKEQFNYFYPGVPLPDGILLMSAERAATLLGSSAASTRENAQ